MPRIRHTASDRNRARLISTPHGTYEGIDPMTSTICGVKFSDQLAALLDHAASADGWRIEAANTSRGKTGSVVVYPANKDHSPITVNERGAKFNKPHYENIRRDLYRAGLPPLPADMAKAQGVDIPPDAVTYGEIDLSHLGVSEVIEVAGPKGRDLEDVMKDSKEHAPLISAIVAGIMRPAGYGDTEIELAARMNALLINHLALQSDVFGAMATRALEEARTLMQKDVDEALALAAENERRANIEARNVERVTQERDKARADCGDALARARTAEARVTELEAVLAPLQAFMSKAPQA